jgi:hypothetical protein
VGADEFSILLAMTCKEAIATSHPFKTILDGLESLRQELWQKEHLHHIENLKRAYTATGRSL